MAEIRQGDQVFVRGTVTATLQGTKTIEVKMPDGERYYADRESIVDPTALAVEALEELRRHEVFTRPNQCCRCREVQELLDAKLALLRPKPEPVALTWDTFCDYPDQAFAYIEGTLTSYQPNSHVRRMQLILFKGATWYATKEDAERAGGVTTLTLECYPVDEVPDDWKDGRTCLGLYGDESSPESVYWAKADARSDRKWWCDLEGWACDNLTHVTELPKVEAGA